MKTTLIAVSLLLAVAVSGCGRCDWVGAGQHYECEHPNDLAKLHDKWAADEAREKTETRAEVFRQEAQEATEETNRQLRKINDQLWWQNMTR